MRLVKRLIDKVLARGSSADEARQGAFEPLEPLEPLEPFDPTSPEIVADPYPAYARLRQTEPVHRCQSGAWLLTRYEHVLSCLADSRLGNAPSPYAVVNERNRERYVCADVANNILPFLDPPRHAAPRRLIGNCFRDYLRRAPVDINEIAKRCLVEAKRGKRFDLIADYATPFSVRVFIELMGLDPVDHRRLSDFSDWFFYLFMQIPSEEVRAKLDVALAEFRSYFSRVIESRRLNPGPDLLSLLVALEGEALREQEIIDTCMLLFADGIENVDKAIASSYRILHSNNHLMRALRDNPHDIKSAVDELLRYDSPAQFVGRVALEDMNLCGVEIRKGASVLLGLASANRDETQFPEADKIIFKRPTSNQLTFGKGRHACIGAPLVRLEVEAGLRALIQGSSLKLADQPPRYRSRPGHRWLQELPCEAI